MTKEKEIEKFINEYRICISDHNLFFTKRVQEDILELELTFEIVKEVIKGLGVNNYVSGPEKDLEFEQFNVWVFGTNIENQSIEIYIKLSDRKDNQRPICISFHKAKRKMNYPYKNEANNTE